MSKSIFDDNDQYTQEAIEADGMIRPIITAMIRKYARKGYSVRELGYLVQAVGFDETIAYILERDTNREKPIDAYIEYEVWDREWEGCRSFVVFSGSKELCDNYAKYHNEKSPGKSKFDRYFVCLAKKKQVG